MKLLTFVISVEIPEDLDEGNKYYDNILSNFENELASKGYELYDSSWEVDHNA